MAEQCYNAQSNDQCYNAQTTNSKLEKLSQTKPVNHKASFPSSEMLNLLPTLSRLKLRCNSYKILAYSSLLNMLFFFKNIFLFSLSF